MRLKTFLLLFVCVTTRYFLYAQSLENGNKFIVIPSMCNAVYVGYPVTLMVPFDLNYYYCKENNNVLKNESANNLLFTAKHKGQINIVVYKKSNNKIVDTMFLRALELPLPKAVITGKYYGKISKELLAQQETFYFHWENVLIDPENISTKIVDSFNVIILRGDNVIYNQHCESFKFTTATKDKLQYLKTGDLFIVNQIYGHLNSLEVEFNPIILEIK